MNRASFSEAEAFLAVADCGGFGAAGRELGVTQSPTSDGASKKTGTWGSLGWMRSQSEIDFEDRETTVRMHQAGLP